MKGLAWEVWPLLLRYGSSVARSAFTLADRCFLNVTAISLRGKIAASRS